MEFHDDFDGRLAAAVSPMVTDAVSADDVRAGALIERRRGVPAGPVVAAAAVLAVGAAAVAVPRLAGPGSVAPPPPSTGMDEASLASVPHVRTADGVVLAERSGGTIRLVLVRDDGQRLVLASKVQAAPAANSSYVSGTIVECPASTGLAQRYYNFGQVNNVPTSAAVTLEGVTGSGAYRNGLYLAAITSDPTIREWRTWIGGKDEGTGGSPQAFATLPSYGAVSAAGCYFDPN